MGARDVVVVGGGAAGILFIAHLAQAVTRPTRVTVVNDGPGRLGAGVAYGTPDPTHLLNVRAGAMGAWQDNPQHFLGWLAGVAESAGRDEFLSRATYGAYLAAVGYDAANGPHVHVEHVRGRAVGLARGAGVWRVRLADGTVLDTRSVILATGVAAPSLRWAPQRLTSAPRFIADPWRPEALAAIGPDARVLVVGTGLTAVDLALSLTRTDRPVAMVSRHGWLPATHTMVPNPELRVPAGELPATLAGARRLVAALVAESKAATGDWRPAVDGLRPYTARLWSTWSDTDRRAFLARDARRWEVARHRMAPQVAARVAALREAEMLTVTAADPAETALRAAAAGIWVINATGPDIDLRYGGDALLRALLANGTAAPGPVGIGLDTDSDGRLRDATGATVPGLYTLGCTRRGQLWESTAIPEIRAQAAALARLLAGGRATPTGPELPRPPAPMRNRPARDLYGLRLATTAVAAAHYNDALGRVLRVQGGAGAALTRAVAEDPSFALGHAALALLAHEGQVDADPSACLVTAEALLDGRTDERTRSFAAAVGARIRRDTTAAGEPLIAHLAAHPLDALAVSACVPTIAFGGATDVPERAWSIVEGLAPAYGTDPWYASMLAFVRQDQHRYAEAAALADRALAEDPASGHAVHARAHVFYETADHMAGLEFLDTWMGTHGQAADHRAHFAWHAALHELALDQPEQARRRFQVQLSPPAVTGVRALVDAGSLLWRDRLHRQWTEPPSAQSVLAAVPLGLREAPDSAFVAMHAALTLAAAGDRAGLDRLHGHAVAHPVPVFGDLIAPLTMALAAYLDERYHTAAQILIPLTDQWRRLGGSDAQRDILDDTLVSALIRCGRCGDAQLATAARLDRRATTYS